MADVPPSRHLLRAKDVADGRYAQKVSVADMAREAGLSSAHFSREFKRVFGEYVTDECDGPVHPGRHSSAKTLLEMDGDPVPRLFPDGPADVRFHRQLVGPISHGHE